eukprot:TRINITY_DN7922_c0_g1_i1.p1 TRINITY_DN7922_c0_g1~~TRINITY_DN7922_c0_g1_i1.p1  ORF type:complete len:1088 (+),score=281.94 TRINITY_DN7922_c0_g1_i1:72-3266(+)
MACAGGCASTLSCLQELRTTGVHYMTVIGREHRNTIRPFWPPFGGETRHLTSSQTGDWLTQLHTSRRPSAVKLPCRLCGNVMTLVMQVPRPELVALSTVVVEVGPARCPQILELLATVLDILATGETPDLYWDAQYLDLWEPGKQFVKPGVYMLLTRIFAFEVTQAGYTLSRPLTVQEKRHAGVMADLFRNEAELYRNWHRVKNCPNPVTHPEFPQSGVVFTTANASEMTLRRELNQCSSLEELHNVFEAIMRMWIHECFVRVLVDNPLGSSAHSYSREEQSCLLSMDNSTERSGRAPACIALLNEAIKKVVEVTTTKVFTIALESWPAPPEALGLSLDTAFGITAVRAGSAAAQAGLKKGQRIRSLGGVSVSRMEQMGDMSHFRDASSLDIKVELAPEDYVLTDAGEEEDGRTVSQVCGTNLKPDPLYGKENVSLLATVSSCIHSMGHAELQRILGDVAGWDKAAFFNATQVRRRVRARAAAGATGKGRCLEHPVILNTSSTCWINSPLYSLYLDTAFRAMVLSVRPTLHDWMTHLEQTGKKAEGPSQPIGFLAVRFLHLLQLLFTFLSDVNDQKYVFSFFVRDAFMAWYEADAGTSAKAARPRVKTGISGAAEESKENESGMFLAKLPEVLISAAKCIQKEGFPQAADDAGFTEENIRRKFMWRCREMRSDGEVDLDPSPALFILSVPHDKADVTDMMRSSFSTRAGTDDYLRMITDPPDTLCFEIVDNTAGFTVNVPMEFDLAGLSDDRAMVEGRSRLAKNQDHKFKETADKLSRAAATLESLGVSTKNVDELKRQLADAELAQDAYKTSMKYVERQLAGRPEREPALMVAEVLKKAEGMPDDALLRLLKEVDSALAGEDQPVLGLDGIAEEILRAAGYETDEASGGLCFNRRVQPLVEVRRMLASMVRTAPVPPESWEPEILAALDCGKDEDMTYVLHAVNLFSARHYWALVRNRQQLQTGKVGSQSFLKIDDKIASDFEDFPCTPSPISMEEVQEQLAGTYESFGAKCHCKTRCLIYVRASKIQAERLHCDSEALDDWLAQVVDRDNLWLQKRLAECGG